MYKLLKSALITAVICTTAHAAPSVKCPSPNTVSNSIYLLDTVLSDQNDPFEIVFTSEPLRSHKSDWYFAAVIPTLEDDDSALQSARATMEATTSLATRMEEQDFDFGTQFVMCSYHSGIAEVDDEPSVYAFTDLSNYLYQSGIKAKPPKALLQKVLRNKLLSLKGRKHDKHN